MSLESWADQALHELAKIPKKDMRKLKELLFFIHVPRTGGRTYHHCLLRHLYPQEQQCDRSYDQLRFNSSKHCRLLATHNDYSVLSKLPLDTTSVTTNLRHPVDRIFSSYEFSVEVAARFLARNPQKFVASRGNKKISGPSTLNIWPWRYLVPWMREDLFSRRAARQSGAKSSSQDFTHYNASFYVMPFHEFLHKPLVMDLLQNGATFQLAGLTNNSYTERAADLRKCVINYPDLGHIVLNVAKRRIDKMILVGLTEKHKDTAILFANVVGGQILPFGQPSTNISSFETNPGLSALPSAFKDSNITNSQPSKKASHSNTNARAAKLTVSGLIEKYENCAGYLRGTQIQRRILSMKNVLPVNFSKEARRQVAEGTLEALRQLNSLDLELYTYAKQRFSKDQLSRHAGSKSSKWELKMPLSQSSKGQRLYDWHLPWSSSGKLVKLMLLTIGGSVATIGVCLFVFLNGRRIVRFQTGSNHAALKEI